jgi:integrase
MNASFAVVTGFGPRVAAPIYRRSDRRRTRANARREASRPAIMAGRASDGSPLLPQDLPVEAAAPEFRGSFKVDEGEISWHEAHVRFLVAQGHPLKSATTLADLTVAIEDFSQGRRGPDRLGPRLLRRGDKIYMTDGVTRPVSTRVRIDPADKTDRWKKNVTANQKLAGHVEKTVRKVLGRVLLSEVGIEEVFGYYLEQNAPGAGAKQSAIDLHEAEEDGLLHLEKYLAGKKVVELGPGIIGQYMTDVRKRTIDERIDEAIDDEERADIGKEVGFVAESTARRRGVLLVKVLNWFCWTVNKFKPPVLILPKLKKVAVRYLTFAEIDRLMEAARGKIFDQAGNVIGHHDKAGRYACVLRFIPIYLWGGTRHLNILYLTWFYDTLLGHIDPENNLIERQGPGAEITNKRRGSSGLLGSLREWALEWKAEDDAKRASNPGRFVHIIHDEKGDPILDDQSTNAAWRMSALFREVRELAGLPNARPHQLKHSGVTFAVKAGMLIDDVVTYFSTSADTVWEYYIHLHHILRDSSMTTPYSPEKLEWDNLAKITLKPLASVRA